MKPKNLAVKNPTPLSLLQRARNLLRTYGWHKGSLAFNNEPNFCAVGALNAAAGAYDYSQGHKKFVHNHAHVQFKDAHTLLDQSALALYGRTNVIDFNDAPTTRKAQVLKVFDHAIKTAKTAQPK